jgi:hypothetical protein
MIGAIQFITQTLMGLWLNSAWILRVLFLTGKKQNHC